jgi:hypothetical protein
LIVLATQVTDLAANSGKLNALKTKSETASEVRKGAVECLLE